MYSLDLRINDLNNVQAMMLFNIGEARMSVGEVGMRGCYLGSSASYNIKKMVETGYLVQERSVHVRRLTHVRLTEKGRELRSRPDKKHRDDMAMLREASIVIEDLEATNTTLRRLGQFCTLTGDLVTGPSYAGVGFRLPLRA